jgi:diguanylate cyclase (GGDEF)-like protein
VQFAQLRGPAQLYVLSICVLAVLQAALACIQPAAQAPLELFALLVLAAAVAHSFPVSTPGKQSYHVSPPFLIAAIILLAPWQLVVLIVCVHLAEWLRKRRSVTAQVFNTAAFTLTGLVAQAAYRVLWPARGEGAADLSQPAFLVAGLVAVVLFALLNRCLVSLAIWLGSRVSPRNQRLFELEGFLTDGVLLLMGVPLAHLALIAPWAAAIGAAPLWLIHRVLDLPNLRSRSRQDGLTELFTAPYLTESCTRELNRARRFDRPVCLLLLDLDGLGQFNAAHGAQAGDAALRSTARTISRTIREYDLPARLAGGLFAVLLPETDLAQAQEVAERIRRETAERHFEVPDSVEQARLTVSIGGTIVDGGNASAQQLFEAAQAALAHAKLDGGNQIEFVTTDVAPPPVMLPGGEAADSSAPISERAAAAQDRQGNLPAVGHAAGAGSDEAGAASRTRFWPQPRRRGARALLGALAAVLLVAGLVWSMPSLDWRMLGVLISVAALAGLAFYFKPLTVALALAIELHRAPARLWIARYWRLWPLYLALAATGLLVAYAYARFGLLGAIALAAAALLFRQLAGQYVDRTLESVRALRVANQQLEHQAFHDPLTSLANRTLFTKRLERAMVRGECSLAVLFLDLDNFKGVNDTLGHGAGDALLLAATGRLRDCVRREDTIGRLGGDEFTVLLEDMRDPSDAVRTAERICEALRTPFELAGQQVVVSASIGIALDTDRSHTPDDLLREADMAMYRAKSGGKARYEIFDTGLGTRAMERLELETELRGAAERGQLVLHYQPIVDLATGSIDAVEALLRWQHPRRGLLEPLEFMPVAEETGIVLDLGQWGLDQACRDAAAWQRTRPGLVVQLNLSPLELQRSALVELVAQALAGSGLLPGCLRLEIPESSVAQISEATLGALDGIQGLGVGIALDDVGEGVSSLAWLSRSPVDTLKIGPSASDSPALVRASIALGAALGMTVTAQGVDGVDQAVRLGALGCRYAQGDLYGAPQTATFIADQRTARQTPRAA